MECLDSEVMQTVVNNTHSQLTQNIVESIDTVLIRWIPIIPDHLPFTYKCLQYLLKIVFTMTIKKLQGRTVQEAGLRTWRILELQCHPAKISKLSISFTNWFRDFFSIVGKCIWCILLIFQTNINTSRASSCFTTGVLKYTK